MRKEAGTSDTREDAVSVKAVRVLLAGLSVCAAAWILAAGCKQPEPRHAAQEERRPDGCALIVTDDDIPSGSATAGALYVKDSELGKKLLTRDIVAVAKGFRDGGIQCVHVVDSHDGAVDPLPLRRMGVEVLTPSTVKGWTWPFIGPMRRKYVVAALIGFHSNAGQVGFRPHTINDAVAGLRIGGERVGEVAHLIIGLGAFGTPVVLISGDMNATAEAERLLPDVERVTVRWLDADGKAKFMSSEEAWLNLYTSARRTAGSRAKPYSPRPPISIEIKLHSAGLMSRRGPGIVQAFRDRLGREPQSVRSMIKDSFGAKVSVTGKRLAWTAPSALDAFVSIAFAASFLKGPGTWEDVSRGYAAFKACRYEEALAAYKRSLARNVFDVATRCRMGAVYRNMGELEKARSLFAYGVSHLEEIGGIPMKSFCAAGLSGTEMELDHMEAARKAASLVLSISASGRWHDEAVRLLGWIKRSGSAESKPLFFKTRSDELCFVARKIESAYSYLDVKQKRYGFSFARLTKEYVDRVERIGNEKDYNKALDSYLLRFHDKNLKIIYDYGRHAVSRRKGPSVSHRFLSGRVLLTRIAFLSRKEAVKELLEEGLSKIRRARALVVDLRGGAGDDDAPIYDYLSQISAKEIGLGRISFRMSKEAEKDGSRYSKMLEPDPERPGFSRWLAVSIKPRTKRGFNGPIAVLIDGKCEGFCENAALAFKESKLARLFGQKTRGSTADTVSIKLPFTSGKLVLSTLVRMMPDGNLLEDNGVAPDVRVYGKKDALSAALDAVRKQLRSGRKGWEEPKTKK